MRLTNVFEVSKYLRTLRELRKARFAARRAESSDMPLPPAPAPIDWSAFAGRTAVR